MKGNVLLVGGRSKAKALAQSLLKKGYRVTVINKDLPDCEKLAENEKLTVIHGDGTKPYVLEDAGAGNMEIAIALTPRDEDNLVVCELCKKKFRVPKTLSLLSDPQKTDFFYKMGVDSVVCAISAVTSIIEQQAFMEEMAKAIPIGEGSVSEAVPLLWRADGEGRRNRFGCAEESGHLPCQCGDCRYQQ